VARCRELGFDRIALTDHNTAEGALELQRMEPELAIVGEEVKTTEGEVIGLFISRTIPAGMAAEVVMDEIHRMGGLTYMPHPVDRRRYHFRPQRLVELADRIDIIETHNPWCDPGANQAAARLAADLAKIPATGSDSHAPYELGHSWMEMEPFEGAQDFLEKLARARHVVTSASGSQRRA
jgi:predicted metal-dependent phosphoesterase TrpH